MTLDRMHMRALLVHPGSTLGGGSLACIQTAEFLRAHGHQTLIVFNGEGDAAEVSRQRGFETLVLPVPRWFCGFELDPRHADPRMALEFVRTCRTSVQALSRLIRERGIDLVYANTSPALTAIVAARRAGVPVVCHVRESLNRARFTGRAHLRFIERHADWILTSTDYSTSFFRRRERVVRVYDGMPNPERVFTGDEVQALRRAWDCGPEHRVVGVVGAVNTIKGHFFLMDAMPEIHRRVPDARFVFIGAKAPAAQHRGLRARLRTLVRGEELDADARLAQLGVSQIAHFTGWIDHVPLAMAAADVIAFPSIVPEGFGRPPVEAGLAGKPVVAFDVGPSSEIIRHGETGLLVPFKNRAALAGALSDLLLDPERCRKLGECGREHTAKHFSEDRYREEMNAVLEEAWKSAHSEPAAALPAESFWQLVLPRGGASA